MKYIFLQTKSSWMTHVSSRAARLTKQSLGKSGLGHRECQCPETPPGPSSRSPPPTVSAAQRAKGAAVRGSSDTQLKLLSGRRAAPKRKVQKISGLGHPALAPVNVGERRVPPHLNSSLAPPNHLKITHTTIRRSHPSAERWRREERREIL